MNIITNKEQKQEQETANTTGEKEQETAIATERAEYELKPHQRQDYEEILKSLGLIKDNNAFVSDNICSSSSTGAGKTSQICCVCAVIDPDYIIVVGYECSRETWKRHSTWFNLEDRMQFHTYNNLAPKEKGKKTDLLIINQNENKTWSISKTFKQMLNKKVVIIYDEAHALKNDKTDKRRASNMINKEIRRSNPDNKILFLTATPTDKPELKYVWLHHFNIMLNETPYTSTREGVDFGTVFYYTDGLESILDWLQTNEIYIKNKGLKYDEAVLIIRDAINNPDKKSTIACEFIYDEIAEPMFMHSMPNIKPTNCLSYTLLAENLFTEAEKKEIDKILAKKAWIEEREMQNNYMAMMQKILKNMEIAKASMMARLTDIILKHNPDSKVVVQFNYNKAIDIYNEECQKLGYNNICQIVGSVESNQGNKEHIGDIGDKTFTNPSVKSKRKIIPVKTRETNRKKYQEDNNECRIAILSSVGQMSIDLDDQTGNHPRILLLVSSYNTTGMVQTMGRIHRNSTLSNCLCILVFYNLKERLTKRHREKVNTLMKTTRMGSIPITDKTPYVIYNTDTKDCSMFTILPKSEQIDRVLLPSLPLAMYTEEAYRLYRETNPIDMTGWNTPKDRKVVKVTVEYLLDKKKKKTDTIYIATDLPIDKRYLDEINPENLLDQIYTFYMKEGLTRRYPVTILDYEDVAEGDETLNSNIDYYFPGFRIPV